MASQAQSHVSVVFTTLCKTTMAYPGGARLVLTGWEDRDGILAVSFVLLCGILILDIAYVFLQAYRESRVPRRNASKGGAVQWRKIYVFLTLAVVAFLVVNGLKLNLRELSTASWKEIEKSVEDLKFNARHVYGRHFESSNTYVYHACNRKICIDQTSVLGRYAPDFYVRDLKHSIERLRNGMQKTKAEGTYKPEQLLEKVEELVGISHSWRNWREHENIWDNFKILVASPSRFFWTQQWFSQ